MGTEPLSQMTNQYNDALKAHLPQRGIELREIPRLEQDSIPVSASAVRAALAAHDTATLEKFLPETTARYLQEKLSLY